MHIRSFGGEGGIRTPGTLVEYVSLANWWFQPLTHLTMFTGATPQTLSLRPCYLAILPCSAFAIARRRLWGYAPDPSLRPCYLTILPCSAFASS